MVLSVAAARGRCRCGGRRGEHEGGARRQLEGTGTPSNEVANIASLQRGARNFMSYCQGCHSLKYLRYSRTGAKTCRFPPEQLEKFLLPPGDKPADYILTSMPPADAEAWFGKAPPDLSLMARARGRDYLYQFLKTFYADPSKPTGVNNLRLDSTAMPHVLSELEGVKKAVFKDVEVKGEDGEPHSEQVFEHFETRRARAACRKRSTTPSCVIPSTSSTT